MFNASNEIRYKIECDAIGRLTNNHSISYPLAQSKVKSNISNQLRKYRNSKDDRAEIKRIGRKVAHRKRIFESILERGKVPDVYQVLVRYQILFLIFDFV